MSFRNTIIVAILFLGLGAYLYFVESGKMRDEAKKPTLVSVKADEITAITLEYPESSRTIGLRKSDDRWRIEQPIAVEADQTAAANLARAIADAELKRTLEGELKPLETYGLEKPDAIVRVELADGRKLPAIRVGKTTPVGYSTFVQLDDQPGAVKLVASAFSTGMKKDVKDLRDKEIVDFQDEDVRKVAIQTEDSTIELVRDDKKWRIEKPDSLAADESEVRSFLSSLRSLRAQDFVDRPDSLASYGLDSPRRRITLFLGKDQAQKTVIVGSEKEKDKKKELYVKRGEGETVYAVGSYAWSNLGKTVSSFRDKTVLAFEKDQAGAIEISRADGGTFRLVREKSAEAAPTPVDRPSGEESSAQWVVEGAPEKSRETQVTQLVGDIQGLKGYEIAAENPGDLASFGLANPALVFSVVDRDGKPLGRILASQMSGEEDAEKKSYAMREGASVVYRIRDYLYAHLDKKREDLVEPPAAEKTEGAAAPTPSSPS